MAQRGAQKGNKNAAKGRTLSKMLQKRLEERAEQEALMDTLLNRALEGDMVAIKEVFDRIDGKAQQSIDMQADITARSAKELTDDELADIAARSR